jgi:predicted nucleic acid-binding protein
MDNFVTDTQALVKFMMGKKAINDRSFNAYQSADKGLAIIIIPAVVLMEILYLFEKHRIDVGLLHTKELIKSRNYQFEPLSFDILMTASNINDIPELHDRLIAATAKYLGLLFTSNPFRLLRSWIQPTNG